jgi:hypothetical protein
LLSTLTSTGTRAAASSSATIHASVPPVMMSRRLYSRAMRSASWMSLARCASTTSGSRPASTGCSASRSSRLTEKSRVSPRSKPCRLRA